MLPSKLNGLVQGPQIEGTNGYHGFHNSDFSIPYRNIKGIQFDATTSFSLTDSYLMEQLNNKLNITEEKLKLTMDEIIQACQEKYPYKFI